MPATASPLLYWPALLVGAYLLGSVPFAQVAARLNGVDLRQVGTGNVGAGNLSRQVGWGWGIAAAVLDGLKGLLPVWLARRAGLGLGVAGLTGLAAVVGHNWSVLLKGRAGRGLATSVGLVLGIDPALLVWTGGWSIAGWKIGGGLAGFLGWGMLPLVAVALLRPPHVTLLLALLSLVLMGRRMQGNPEDFADTNTPPLKRVIYDEDLVPEEFPDTVEGPLVP
ncbi:MAG: glycerol-3-phosphate acyltransferase [Actinobacteria bacterium]|nr:glycerol-3-phosphate acyltransferase [Actinomycetota bacterium]